MHSWKAGLAKSALRVAHVARAAAVDQRQRLLADWQLGAAYVDVWRIRPSLRTAPLSRSETRFTRAKPNGLPKPSTVSVPPWKSSAGTQQQPRRTEASARYATEHECVEVLINTLISHANVEHSRADPRSALDHLEQAQELAARDGMERQAMWIMASRARALQFMGKYDKAFECTEEVKTRSQLLGNRHQYITSQGVISEILIKLGRPAQATDRLQRVLEMSPGEPLKTYMILTLSEAMLEEVEPKASEVAELLRLAEQEKGRTPLIKWGQIVVSLEYHARFGTRPSDDLWQRFEASLEQEGLDPALAARGWLAWSKEKIRCRDWRTALKACTKALEALDGRHHDLAAQVYLSMSKAHKIRAAHTESNIALERGQEELRKAADLIEDEDLCNDFLARPVFRDLRKKRETFADAKERLGGLYDMVHALNTGGDPEDHLGVILDQALRVVRAERGLILLRSEGDDQYQVRFSRNLESQTVEEVARFSRSAVLAAGRGEPVLAINAANDERVSQMKSVSAYGIKSLLCVPLRIRDELVGAVYADSRADGAFFNQQDLQFLEAFADHAALALENARALRRLEQRRAQLLSATQSRESSRGDRRPLGGDPEGVRPDRTRRRIAFAGADPGRLRDR